MNTEDKEDNWLLATIYLWMTVAFFVLMGLVGCVSRTEINNAKAVTISVSPQTTIEVKGLPLP